MRTPVLVTCLVVVLGCSAPAPAPVVDAGLDAGVVDDGGAAVTSACVASATAQCAVYERCERGGAATLFGSVAACVDRLASQCVTGWAAPGAVRSLGAVDACTTARASQTCEELLDNVPPVACRSNTGTRDAGAPCVFNAQCQSAWCDLHRGACGACAEQPAPGAPCADSACGYGQACVTHVEDGGLVDRCVNVVATVGAICSKYQPCGAGLSCVGARLFADAGVRNEGACVPDATDAGAACDSRLRTDAGCVARFGLFCSPATEQCTPVTPVAEGLQCGGLDGGVERAVCSLGASCLSGVCVAPVGLGVACDTTLGPLCARPLRCVTDGGSTGSCVALDPSACQ